MKRIIISVAIVIGLAVVLMPSMADASIPVDEAYWDTLNVPPFVGRSAANTNEIKATGDWVVSGEEITIAWYIQYDEPGDFYTYQYVFNKPKSGGAALSHWILEVTDPSTKNDFWGFTVDSVAFDPFTDDGPKTYTSGSGNPGMPVVDDIYGIKFDTGGTSFIFKTWKDPVWGDFYAKDGSASVGAFDFNVAYNTGFGNDPICNFCGWIPTPNGGNHEVPEPASMALLGSGLLGFAGLKRKK